MKSVIVVLFLVSALFAEQVADFINLNKIISLNVPDDSENVTVNFVLQGKDNNGEKVTVSGNYIPDNNNWLSVHIAEYLGVKTIRYNAKVLKAIFEAAE